MASTSTATAKRSFLPAGFVTFIRRRLIELGGLLVIALAIAFAAALSRAFLALLRFTISAMRRNLDQSVGEFTAAPGGRVVFVHCGPSGRA